MPLPTKEFEAQAEKAGRTATWPVDAGLATFLALFIAALALLLFSSAPWFGVLGFAISSGIVVYVIRRVVVGRRRDLICPNCGCTGKVVLIQQSYQFHCPRCDQTADTGVSTSGE